MSRPTRRQQSITGMVCPEYDGISGAEIRSARKACRGHYWLEVLDPDDPTYIAVSPTSRKREIGYNFDSNLDEGQVVLLKNLARKAAGAWAKGNYKLYTKVSQEQWLLYEKMS